MTNWQDTVMTGEEVSQEIQMEVKKWCVVPHEFIEDIAHIIATKQAKIAFNEGIREMSNPTDKLLKVGREAIENALIVRFSSEGALKIGLGAMGQTKIKGG